MLSFLLFFNFWLIFVNQLPCFLTELSRNRFLWWSGIVCWLNDKSDWLNPSKENEMIGIFFRNWNYNLRFFAWILKLKQTTCSVEMMLWQTLIAVVSRMFVFFALFNCFQFSYCKPRHKFLFPSGIRFSKFLNELFNRFQSPSNFRNINVHIFFVTKRPFIWFLFWKDLASFRYNGSGVSIYIFLYIRKVMNFWC